MQENRSTANPAEHTTRTPARGPDGQNGPAGAEEGALSQCLGCMRETIRQHPEAACLWSLGIGFVLGWKLKLW